LAKDPEETENLANSPVYAEKKQEMHGELLKICDPEAMDQLAHADQAALIDRMGGREAALKLGAPGATPPPEVLA